MPVRPRRQRPPGRSASSRLASVFFAIGCLVVLGLTFALGVSAGRHWPDGLPIPGLRPSPAPTAVAKAPPESRRTETRGFDKDKTKSRTETAPVLTFYQELTAPLAPAPARPAAKPDRPETTKVAPRPAGEPVKPAARDAAPSTDAAAALAPSPRPETRYTVQVGAFKARAQAEALRARLAESGQDAYLSEVESGGTTQYRVRVGTFATREAAIEVASRIGSQRRLATYVTTR